MVRYNSLENPIGIETLIMSEGLTVPVELLQLIRKPDRD